MSWQDWVIGAGQLLFAVALVPAVFSRKRKPPFFTSMLTSVVLFSMAVCFVTLGLWFSFGSASVCAFLWGVLAWQVSTPRLCQGCTYRKACAEDGCVMERHV